MLVAHLQERKGGGKGREDGERRRWEREEGGREVGGR